MGALVSLGALEDDNNNTISMAESDMEDWSCSPMEDSAAHCSGMSNFPEAIDQELLSIMTKAVNKLGLVFPH